MWRIVGKSYLEEKKLDLNGTKLENVNIFEQKKKFSNIILSIYDEIMFRVNKFICTTDYMMSTSNGKKPKRAW